MKKASGSEYIDIHTHSARDSGIYVMNVFAQDLEQGISEGVMCSIGLHPWHLEDQDINKCMALLRNYAPDPHVLAIGEAGLDRNIQTSLEKQKEVFVRHIILSEQVKKPLIIHCVKSYSDVLEIRKTDGWKMPWMMHWFNENISIANELIRWGCYLSFGRSLLHPNGRNAEVFRNVPPEYVFFETDDAEIAIGSVYAKAAEVRGIPVDELQRIVAANFEKIFYKANKRE